MVFGVRRIKIKIMKKNLSSRPPFSKNPASSLLLKNFCTCKMTGLFSPTKTHDTRCTYHNSYCFVIRVLWFVNSGGKSGYTATRRWLFKWVHHRGRAPAGILLLVSTICKRPFADRSTFREPIGLRNLAFPRRHPGKRAGFLRALQRGRSWINLLLIIMCF